MAFTIIKHCSFSDDRSIWLRATTQRALDGEFDYSRAALCDALRRALLAVDVDEHKSNDVNEEDDDDEADDDATCANDVLTSQLIALVSIVVVVIIVIITTIVGVNSSSLIC